MSDVISLLIPSRGRTQGLVNTIQGALATADDPEMIEVIVLTDHDDPASAGYISDRNNGFWGARWVHLGQSRDHGKLSQKWNECWTAASGAIGWQGNDDVFFRTTGWDVLVREAFDALPDRIAFVHGRDGHPEHDGVFGTLGFLSREWVDAVGYFTPPYFTANFGDTWLNAVASLVGRRVYLEDVLTEHLHHSFGKSAYDQTYRERDERDIRDRNGDVWSRPEMLERRQTDANKLRAVMA